MISDPIYGHRIMARLLANAKGNPRLNPGTEVRILRADIWEFRNWTKKRPHGRVVRKDGGYLYVRPLVKWWGKRPALELYDGEVEAL